MNIFTALKVTKRAHAGSLPSWEVISAEKTNTENMFLSMERNCFGLFLTSSGQLAISADPTTVAGLKIPETSDLVFG